MKKIQLLFLLGSLLIPSLMWGQVSGITDVTLTFTPTAGGTPVVATATDAGQGLTVSGPINLMESTEYDLSIGLMAGMTDLVPTINAEDTSYLFYFAFTDSAITSPAGDGNIDMRADPINYSDMDANGLPIGLATSWEPECGDSNIPGEFRVLLAFQAGSKSATSASTDGTTVLDLTWDLSIAQDPNAPPCENEEEIITDVTLAFVPTAGGDTVFATAQDPDGPGPLDLVVQDTIQLMESTEYTMSMTIFNSIEGEDITMEIMQEDDEHMFFFAFSDDAFESPVGDGNVDMRADPVNYNDFDGGGLPLGLSTDWGTSCGEDPIIGTFQVILKHQPGVKTATSTVMDGDTDFDLTFDLKINLDPNAPPCENEEEIITDVTLAFVPVTGGDTVFATAVDPDGPGPLDLTVQDTIQLMESTEYLMGITLFNSIEMEDITAEIMDEDDEHMFFFAFTDEVFTSPAGDGNVDNRPDPVNYNDFDDNSLPVGLSTNWETNCGEDPITGTFQVILKHQPGVKSATSTVADGGTDVDLTFDVKVNLDPNAPPCENEEEIITDVTLSFVPTAGGDTVFATATDPDGPGPLDLMVDSAVNLIENTEYDLSIELFNSIEGEDITEEIEEEDNEHMFFFAWTGDLFTDPTGDGNADNRDDSVRYVDFDENNLPVGLSTQWTTSMSVSGDFRVVLKHQPDIKSATSTINDGDSDIDLTWSIGTVTSVRQNLQSSASLKLWPNPASNLIRWEIESLDRKADRLQVLDMYGRIVLESNDPQQQINIAQLAKGNYMLIVDQDNKRWVKRFVKMN